MQVAGNHRGRRSNAAGRVLAAHMRELFNRVAFITGGASGIGLAMARRFASAGMRIVLADINEAELGRAVAGLGGDVMGIVLDIRDAARWRVVAEDVSARFGGVDLLCNNAGIGPDGQDLADTNGESFGRIIAINLLGAQYGIATFVPGMRERGYGHVVNTASMAGLTAASKLGGYTASKFALVGLTEVLRMELAPFGVGASVLCPGLVQSQLRETTLALGSDCPAPPGMTNAGIDPHRVAAQVLDSVKEDRPYVITHPQFREAVATRMEAVLSAFDAASQRPE